MFNINLKKFAININFSIFKIIGLNYFVYLFFIFINIKNIIREKNLNILNNIFKKLKINFKNKIFFIDISAIDNISGENNCFGLIREIFFKNVYLSKFIFTDSSKNDCIDLGANIGIFSLLASKFFNNVYSIEPQIKYIDCYKKLISDNHVTNAFLINGYLYNSNEFDNDYANLIDFNKLVKKESLKDIFLKIDIEGSEFGLFQDINLNKVSAISMEVHQNNGNLQNILEKLMIYDFDYVLCNSLGEVVSNHNLATYLYGSKKHSSILLLK
jgi:hypothetical protein